MKVLSLFDGMACGMIAMQKAGIEVDRCWLLTACMEANEVSS